MRRSTWGEGRMKRTKNEAGDWNRRDLLKFAALAWAVPVFSQARGGQRGQAAEQKGTELVLLGTQGGPSVSANRTQASSVVNVDGRPYLVDCGYGAIKALV